MTIHSKKQLSRDFNDIAVEAMKASYGFSLDDAFAIGYMAAKAGLDRLIYNEKEVVAACRAYDKTDDLMLLDTIAETLLDLGIIKESASNRLG